MQAFDYITADSVDQVIALLSEHDDARILSGGTDLIVGLREGRLQTSLVIDVKRVAETTALTYDETSGLTLGAAVPCRRMVNDRAVAAAYPGLMDAATLVGGVQIQGRASMGGNLCNASPAADSIPALIAHYAAANVAGRGGTREIPVEDFCIAPGRNALEPGEFLVSMQMAAPQPGFGAAYLRFIPRNEMDIAVVGCGASVQLSDDGSTFDAIRVALAAVAPKPLLVEAVEALAGEPATDETIEEAARLAREAATPISDMRGTAAYRKHLAGVMTKRTLKRALERARLSRSA